MDGGVSTLLQTSQLYSLSSSWFNQDQDTRVRVMSARVP